MKSLVCQNVQHAALHRTAGYAWCVGRWGVGDIAQAKATLGVIGRKVGTFLLWSLRLSEFGITTGTSEFDVNRVYGSD